jgi:signal transduction histidine kinase
VKRTAVLVFAAVILAAAVLAVLGYLSLRQWEAGAELLFREQARDVAAMAAEKIEMSIAQAEEQCLGDLQRALAGPAEEAQALADWRRKATLVDRAYLFDRARRLLYPDRVEGQDAARLEALLAEIPPGFWDRGARRHLTAGGEVVLAAVLQGRSGRPILAVLLRNEAYLRREVLARALGAFEGKTTLAILDAAQRPVYASQPLDGARPLLSVALGETLPAWRVALYQPRGLSPRQAVRRQTLLFTGAFALLLVVIGVGLGAAYRMVRRESEMARLKSDFVANVSHDLKTPLSLIRMFAETLELGRVTDEAARREYYAVITRESERLTRLINNVLDFSRIEGGRQRYDLRPGALPPVVHEALEAFRYPLAQGGFTLEVDVAPDLPPVTMDAAAVGQALANLVDNAIKYSGQGRTIRVEARRADGEVCLAVEDRGIGIPPGEVSRIFDKFYRVGRSETQGRRGSGLGLSLVRHVAQAHGGRVSVESRPGAGSRFTLHLPLGPAGAAGAPGA